ncbi:C39 family peptidase [Paenibacillus ehimensis]|uniref:C39 family peptidase n=1 Tax=Paenibacillus ehimensis TaxID=79264 RepID=UPI002DB576F3|nr:C39 family peptidase [Paenibacillus ehimensis]MEC0211372.1 C39 family peptidase [Paenibacillus ehimensis]
MIIKNESEENLMKKLLICGTMSVSLLVAPFSAFADNSAQQNPPEKATRSAKYYMDIVAKNSHPDWKGSSLSFEETLYDFDDKITSYLYTVKDETSKSDEGYIIVSAGNDPIVLESTREGSHPYKGKKAESERPVYVGGLLHFVKVDGDKNSKALSDTEVTIKDLRNNNTLKKSELKSKGLLSEGVKLAPSENKGEDIAPASRVSYSKRIISGVPDHSWEIGCSPSSMSNIIKYWDNNGYPNLVQDNTTPSTLIDVLATYMKTDRNNGGTTQWDDRVHGTWAFWSDRYYNGANVKRVSPSYSGHKDEINSNRPDIINTVNDPNYTNHDMTGVGYEEYQDTDQNFRWFTYVIVHDTWPSTPTDAYVYTGNLKWNESIYVTPVR